MKQIDRNGFWQIKNNPISKVGIFPYLGKQIDDSLEPDKIYMVLRPEEELFNSEALESFNGVPVPLINEHTMLGEEYTPAEKKGVAGVVTNIRREGDTLAGDISIYSEDMKEKITNGKKELSLGYFCSYDLTPGVFNGQKYDAIQRDIRSNHIALVDRGRCGSDVRVFDKWCFDCAIEKAEEKQTEGKITMATVFDQLSILKAVIDEQLALFKEEDHPRAKNGQFASKGQGGSGGGSSKTAAIKQTGSSSNAGGAGAKKQAGKQESKLPTKPLDQTKAWKGWLDEGVRVGDYYNGLKDGDRKKQAEEACRLIELCEGDNNQHLEKLIAEKGLNSTKLFLMKAAKPFKEENTNLYKKTAAGNTYPEYFEDLKHRRLVGGAEHSIEKAINDIKDRMWREQRKKELEAAPKKEEENKTQQSETPKQESEAPKKEESKQLRTFNKEEATNFKSQLTRKNLQKWFDEKGALGAIEHIESMRPTYSDEEFEKFTAEEKNAHWRMNGFASEAINAIREAGMRQNIRNAKGKERNEPKETPVSFKNKEEGIAEARKFEEKYNCLREYKALQELINEKGKAGAISYMKGYLNAFRKLEKEVAKTARNFEDLEISNIHRTAKNSLHLLRYGVFKEKNSQDVAIKCLRNTTSNSGLTASMDANINQSKLEELRNMIDKDKLLALKELVQMLEGETTTPEATADKEEDGDKDNDLDLLDDEGKEESEDADTEEAGKLDFEDDEEEEEDKEEAKDADTDEPLIDLKDDEDKKKKEKKSEDELPSKIFKMLADRDSLVKKVKPIIGNFDFQKMTVDQVAKYACDKLDIETSNPREAINGYLKGYKRSSTYSLDSGIKEQSTTQSQIEAYLKGSK